MAVGSGPRWSAVFLNVLVASVSQRLFPEADTGFRQSQASRIWRELEEEEEEEEGLAGGPRGPSRSAPRRRRTSLDRAEEDGDGGAVSVCRRRTRRMSDYPNDDCVRYVVLGTLVAVLALLVNLVYPLLSRATWT